MGTSWGTGMGSGTGTTPLSPSGIASELLVPLQSHPWVISGPDAEAPSKYLGMGFSISSPCFGIPLQPARWHSWAWRGRGATKGLQTPGWGQDGAQHPPRCLLHPGDQAEGDELQEKPFPSPSQSGFINSSRGDVSINNGARSWLPGWVMRFSTCCSCAAAIVFGGQNSMWIN